MLKTLRLALVALAATFPALAAPPTPASRTIMDAAMATKAAPAHTPIATTAPATPVTSTAAPLAAARPACPATVAGAALVDVNSADVDGLDTLYGIGPSRAKDIIAERKKGLYEKPSDLVRRNVLPQSVFDCLKDRVALANANKTSADDMAEVLPGIGAARAKAIVDGRKKGTYKTIADVAARASLPQNVVDGIKSLIAF